MGGGGAAGAAAVVAAPFAAVAAVGALAYVGGTKLIDSYFAALAAEQSADALRWYSKKQHEREGDGTRGLDYDQIREKFKHLSPGQLKKLLQQVEKLRGVRNARKRGGQ
jgi:hypothetical protein